MKPLSTHDFARALRELRLARGLSQEAFDVVSGRTYVSALERAVKQPTLSKVDELASVIGIHPVTLLVASYCRRVGRADAEALLAIAKEELGAMFPSGTSKR